MDILINELDTARSQCPLADKLYLSPALPSGPTSFKISQLCLTLYCSDLDVGIFMHEVFLKVLTVISSPSILQKRTEHICSIVDKQEYDDYPLIYIVAETDQPRYNLFFFRNTPQLKQAVLKAMMSFRHTAWFIRIMSNFIVRVINVLPYMIHLSSFFLETTTIFNIWSATWSLKWWRLQSYVFTLRCVRWWIDDHFLQFW